MDHHPGRLLFIRINCDKMDSNNSKTPLSKNKKVYAMIIALLIILAAMVLYFISPVAVPDMPTPYQLSSTFGTGTYTYCNGACLTSNNTGTDNYTLLSSISFQTSDPNNPTSFKESIHLVNTSIVSKYGMIKNNYNSIVAKLAQIQNQAQMASGTADNFTYSLILIAAPGSPAFLSLTGYKNNLFVSVTLNEPNGALTSSQETSIINTIAQNLR